MASYTDKHNIQRMMMLHSEAVTFDFDITTQEFDFHPTTFILPRDWNVLKELAMKEQTKWIAKPVFGGQVRNN